MQQQLVAVVDRGAIRLHACDLPRLAAASTLMLGYKWRTQALHHLIVCACAACSEAEPDVQQRLVAVVDRGAIRPHACDLPRSAAGRRFRQQCLRAMYVLCSRAAEAPTAHSCLLQVLPVAHAPLVYDAPQWPACQGRAVLLLPTLRSMPHN